MNIPKSVHHGTVCVARSYAGFLQAMPLTHQHAYPEWLGCFTVIEPNLYRQYKSMRPPRIIASTL